MNNFFDNQRILSLIWKRKFHFVLVGIISIVLSGIFSGPGFIKPKFKSTARIYPTNLAVVSDESRTEQLLEIISSQDVTLKMLDAFELNVVYGIRKDDPYYLTTMLDMYNENVSASKTEYETVEIKVMDYLPERASNMCDSIIHFYNRKVGEMHKAKNLEMVEIAQRLLKKKYVEIDSIKTQLNNIIKEYGILDFKNQVPEITRGYMKTLVAGKGATTDGKKVQDIYSNFSDQGLQAQLLESRFKNVAGAIDSLTLLYEVYLNEYEKDITYCNVVQHPLPAEKKSYPVRWLIVACSTVSAVFLALLVFLLLDYRKKD